MREEPAVDTQTIQRLEEQGTNRRRIPEQLGRSIRGDVRTEPCEAGENR